MSDVIRRAIIELELRTKRSGLGLADTSQVQRAAEQQQAAMRQSSTLAESAARKQEEFGRRSSYAYSRGISGITEFSRGLALLAADGSENNEKLLRSIVKVQAGVDLVRGSLLLMRLGPEFGGIAAVVAAGAGAWLLYSQQVEKAKQQLRELNAEHAKAMAAEQKFQTQQARISGDSSAARVNAEQNPRAKYAAEAAELVRISTARANQIGDADSAERSMQAAQRRAVNLKYQATQLPSGVWDAVLKLGPLAAQQAGEIGGGDLRGNVVQRAIAQHEQAVERAGLAAKGAEGFKSQARDALQLALAGAQHQRELQESQRDYEYTRLEAQHKSETESLGELPSAVGAHSWRDRQSRLRQDWSLLGRQGLAEASGGEVDGAGSAVGVERRIAAERSILNAIGRGRGDQEFRAQSSQLGIRQDNETRAVQDKWSDFLKGTIAVVEQLQSRLNALENNLDNAASTNAGP